jgi:DNA polymerase III subunit alpha
VTQYDMSYVEKIGLVKFDFLGLKNLTVIDNAVRLIRAGKAPDFDLSALGDDDAEPPTSCCRAATPPAYSSSSRRG